MSYKLEEREKDFSLRSSYIQKYYYCKNVWKAGIIENVS